MLQDLRLLNAIGVDTTTSGPSKIWVAANPPDCRFSSPFPFFLCVHLFLPAIQRGPLVEEVVLPLVRAHEAPVVREALHLSRI